MTICLTLSYFFARNNHSMAQNNDPMPSAQAERTQGNPPGTMSIEAYILQVQHFLSSTAQQLTEFRQSQSALEARVISLQNEINRPDERQGEPSFVVKPFTGDKKERTEEAICTWLGRWESHFELYPTPDSTKIAYVGRELGGKAAAWWRGLRTLGRLPETWTDFVTVFKGQFQQPLRKIWEPYRALSSYCPLKTVTKYVQVPSNLPAMRRPRHQATTLPHSS